MTLPSFSTPEAPLSDRLSLRYRTVRLRTESLCEPLRPEDFSIQSMPDMSPPKWHLAHTSWFFETFLLAPYQPGFEPYDPRFGYLFNSYYKTVGPHLERSRRGQLSRPQIQEIYRYRHATDERVLELFKRADERLVRALAPIVELGLLHEEQHQELLLMDIKHLFWSNPLRPAYRPRPLADWAAPAASTLRFDAGLAWIGSDDAPLDNERPRHRIFLEAFGIQSTPVSCGEYLEFMEAGGYRDPSLWLSDGWDLAAREGWQAPLYWEKQAGRWHLMTLAGMRPVDEREPVCHVSYYEADAFARWRGARLPTEAEWEKAAEAEGVSEDAVLLESGLLHPAPARPGFFGNAWEWTSRAYSPYPGFRPLPSSLGEYNGKFMCNQLVLRGGSCATPRAHIRATYRNFYPPHARWQFAGLRLAGDPS